MPPNSSSGESLLFTESCGLLAAWLQLEQLRRNMTSQLFEAGQDQQRTRDLLDQADRRSEELLSLTAKLLDRAQFKASKS